ncbi:MAG: S8 family serine peptidase, partial [Clostridioides sp.]|nr:S8 family serine peptidase [Clostridioides sp.]
MISIDNEVIVKYNGDIMKLEEELGVGIEILNESYAVITLYNESQLEALANYTEIEYIERPFMLGLQDTQSFSRSGITAFKNRTGLTGKGTIIGIIDSGIDYTLPIFRDADGRSKILYYWDQSVPGRPPKGFREGTLYTNEEINNSITGNRIIPITSTSLHGTHVAGISAEIAPEANIIYVRVGNRQTDIFSRSTEFMRAIKFILDASLELKMPVAINISYGTNEGSHKGGSLFEEYINDMCLYWKNNIVVAAGNNADKGGHTRVILSKDLDTEVEFSVGDDKVLNLNIWPDFIDEFSVSIMSPSGTKTNMISSQSRNINMTIRDTTIVGYFYPIEPYSTVRRVTIQLSSPTSIEQGIWRIIFTPKNITNG